jgi:hypothetical protein
MYGKPYLPHASQRSRTKIKPCHSPLLHALNADTEHELLLFFFRSIVFCFVEDIYRRAERQVLEFERRCERGGWAGGGLMPHVDRPGIRRPHTLVAKGP